MTVSGISSSTYAEVTYSEEQATSLNFATFIETATDVIYLYSRTNVGTVTIPTISIGMDYSDITIDATPTSGSGNAVSSGGVYTALTNGTVTKIGTSTVGGDLKPVYLNAGVPTAVANDFVTVDTTQTITGSKTFTASPTSPNYVTLNRSIVQSANSPAGSMTLNFMGRNSGDTADISRAYIQFYHAPGTSSATSTNLLYMRAYKDDCSTYTDLSIDATNQLVGTSGSFSAKNHLYFSDGKGMLTGYDDSNVGRLTYWKNSGGPSGYEGRLFIIVNNSGRVSLLFQKLQNGVWKAEREIAYMD